MGARIIRRLEDVVQAFSLKLWWLFRSQQSLWAQFLLDKYCKSTHPILAPIPHSASAVWRRLKGVGLIAELYIVWQLGQGRIFFWHDCWMGDMTLAQMFHHREHTSVQVVEFFDDTGWDIDSLLLVLPHYMAVQVESLPLCLDVLDRPMGKDTSDGRFSTKSVWHLVRTGSTLHAYCRMIWCLIIPQIISFFCWRLWQDLVPVDVIIQRGFVPTWHRGVSAIQRLKPSSTSLLIALWLTRFSNTFQLFLAFPLRLGRCSSIDFRLGDSLASLSRVVIFALSFLAGPLVHLDS
ncbi:Uncharacterized protein Adt_06502 [Abeliophyllum distichum]|uniref:Reverse transcriptase zinc-binding domain-containing protein n=1 Tax=Abeliophyllum distichum TaxID=126358 RepID=A0ABD1V7L2_9LAMI